MIFYAVDYDTTPTVVTPYFEGINTVAKRPVGVYGGVKIIDGLVGTLAKYGWQTTAWSAGKVSAKACLLQNVFQGDYDTSKILGPFPAWSKAAPEPEPVRVPVTTGQLSPIIPGGSVTTPYGTPGDWAAGYHTGEDWNAPDDLGKPALSAVDGEVVFAGSGGWAAEYGKHVIVEDDTAERRRIAISARSRSRSARPYAPARKSARSAPQAALPALTCTSNVVTSRSATGTTRPRSAICLGRRPRRSRPRSWSWAPSAIPSTGYNEP